MVLAHPRIRRFPWPFSAALAISNDCDYLTLDAMLHLHRFLSGDATEGGVGLEVSDSFFFYQNGSRYPNYSYFDGLSSTETNAAPVIRHLVRLGRLDTTHGLGDFENGGFSRRHTERVLEECQKHGLRIPIWTNHGGPGNWQNIGRKEFHTYHAGDDLTSPHYHLDLLYEMGVRYFWTDVSKSKRISLSPVGAVATERQRRPPRYRIVSPIQRPNTRYELIWSYDRTEVLETFETRSARALQGFVRYDGFLPDGDSGLSPDELLMPSGVRAGPNIGRIAISLSEEKLDTLVRSEGCCFLYQHFSTLAHLPERRHITSRLEFHPDNLAALRRLKDYERRGKIWVAAQGVLLDYLYLLNTVAVRRRVSRTGLKNTVS